MNYRFSDNTPDIYFIILGFQFQLKRSVCFQRQQVLVCRKNFCNSVIFGSQDQIRPYLCLQQVYIALYYITGTRTLYNDKLLPTLLGPLKEISNTCQMSRMDETFEFSIAFFDDRVRSGRIW
jgi:hypothetical protein